MKPRQRTARQKTKPRAIKRARPSAARAATPAVGFHPPPGRFFGFGLSEGQPIDSILLSETLGAQHSAMNAAANRLSMLNLQAVVTRSQTAGTTLEEVLDPLPTDHPDFHPLPWLLTRPHPDIPKPMFLWMLTYWLLAVGKAYILKVGNGIRRSNGTEGGVPVQLHLIPPGKITPEWQDGVIARYLVTTGGGGFLPLPKSVVIGLYRPNPEAPWAARGYLGPQAQNVDAFKFTKAHLRAYYQHDATSKVALEAGPEAVGFSDEALTAFYDRWRSSYHSTSGERLGLPMIGPSSYKFVELKGTYGESLAPLLEFWRDEILMGFQTPRSILGQVVAGDRASVDATNYNYDQKAIQPLTVHIESAFTEQLAHDFDPKLSVRFEQFLAEDKDFRLREEMQDLEHAVRTPNMVLEDRKLDPVKWGEKPLIQTKLKPYDPNEKPAQPPTNGATPPAGAEESEEEEETAAAAPRSRSRSSKRRAQRRASRVMGGNGCE